MISERVKSDTWGLILFNLENDPSLPTGALSVPNFQEKLLPLLIGLIAAARQADAPIISLVDNYPPNSGLFHHEDLPASSITEVSGLQQVSGLQLQGPILNSSDSNSIAAIFQNKLPQELTLVEQTDNIWANPQIERILEEFQHQGTQAWSVAGITTDSNIKSSILALRQRGWSVHIIVDAIAGLTEAETFSGLEECRTVGTSLIESSEAILHWKMSLGG
jgi:nicotinamidase-related amidase